MAKLSTYTRDTSITEDDLLTGSNYISLGNYSTNNFKLKDLANFFSNYIKYDDVTYNVQLISETTTSNTQAIATANQTLSTHTSDISANATYSTNLAATFGTFDSNGNLQTLAESFANQVFSTTSSTIFAQSSYVNNLSSSFGTFDSSGNLTSLSQSFANNVMTTTNNARFAESTYVNNLGSSFGTLASDGSVTISEAFADSVITTTASDRFATTTSVNTLTSTVEGKPDIFRQDDAPATTNPVGSIWYDTNDNNKVYVLVSGTPNVWTETSDDRIVTNSQSISSVNQSVTTLSNSLGAEAALIDELQTQFTFDLNGGITGTADALSTSISTAQSNAESASATKVDTLASKFFTGYNNSTGGFTAVSVTEAFANNVFETTTNSDFASASEFTALSAVVGGDDTQGLRADIIENADVIATVEGYAESRYSLKLDANGSFAGMSILAQNGATSDPYSEIRFVADSFKIYNGGQADLSGSYDAPFEVVNNVVKIKSANIGTVSFGDLSNVPTTFVSTVIYADDSSGTNASTTKGANQNFFAIKQAATAWQNGDSVSGLVFTQMTGDTGATGPAGADGQDGADGAQGPQGPQGPQGIAGTNGTDGADGADGIDGTNGVDGRRTSTGILWYYQGQSSAPTVPSTITAGYRFSDGTFNSTSANTLPTNWAYESPLMYAGTASNQYWTVAYTAIETSAGSGYGTVTFASAAVRAFAFNQVVTFNSLSTSGSTTINGDNITTGQIESANYGSVSGNYSTSGSIINLTNGNIYTPNFSVISGTARFKGDLEAAGGTFAGNLEVNGTALVQGSSTSGNFIAATFRNDGTVGSNAAACGIELKSASNFHHRIVMTGGDDSSASGDAAFSLNAKFKLGNNSYSRDAMILNGAGICVPSGTNTTGTYNGKNIIFGSDNGARTTETARMHVNPYFKALFIDTPAAGSNNSPFQNRILVFRKYVDPDGTLESGDEYETEYAYFDTSSNFKVDGDVVAYTSSDKNLKNNITKIKNPLEKVNKLNGYEFDWNEKQIAYTGHDIGVIAQEVEEVLPEIVETRDNGYKAVKYEKIVPLLIESIKELQKQIEELKNK